MGRRDVGVLPAPDEAREEVRVVEVAQAAGGVGRVGVHDAADGEDVGGGGGGGRVVGVDEGAVELLRGFVGFAAEGLGGVGRGRRRGGGMSGSAGAG